MIGTVVETSFRSLRRDRGAFVMSFILPIGFFTIFGFVFGSMRGSSTPRVSVLVVDEDQTAASRSLVRGLLREPSLDAMTHPKATKENPAPGDYTAATAEAAVRSGDAPAALIIPGGFGAHPISFGPASGAQQAKFQILHDSADPVAAQVVAGMLEKTVMTSLPATMAALGSKYFDQEIGGLTPQQRKQMDEGLARLKQFQEQDDAQGTPAASSTAGAGGGMVAVDVRDVVGEKKKSPMISYYAAGGSLLDESESGALDRVLSARVTMTTLLAGKLLYSALLAFAQLTIMFLWAALVFHLDLFQHIPGFLVMTAITSFAVASFGMLLASVARTRGQLGAFSTLIILTMSALGGSMFPKFIMSDLMIKVGYFTFNSWAIEGYQKIFWRDEPIRSLGPEAAVLVSAGVVLFLLARWFARKWEYA
jgi:ABC-2 type transport system permease protein